MKIFEVPGNRGKNGITPFKYDRIYRCECT